MYPFLRALKEIVVARRSLRLETGNWHVTQLIVWPWDIDMFRDLNNGRVLTLFDIGRIGLFVRMGFFGTMKENGWYGTVAGTAVRYRRRITIFQKLELRTRIIGWDARFIYFEQGFWRGGDCAAHAVVRTAVTAGKGIVPPSEAVRAAGLPEASPVLPDWVRAWSEAEQLRPWPPV